MTGFGRTGRWFGLDHWGVRPDLLVAAKGATSGYWPFGFVAASDAVHEAVTIGPRVRPRVHLLARPGGGGGGQRGPAHPRGRGAGRGERRRRGSGCGPGSWRRLGRAPERRGDPRSWPARRHGARRGPRDPGAVPAQRPPDRGGRPGRARARRAASTPGPATRMARTATRSCSARRSSSPTTSSAGSWRCSREVVPAAVAGLGRARPVAAAAVSDGG